jgi:small GTP-binding protein
MTQESRIKIVLIGEPAVGKTSVLQKYSMNMFNDKYSATILMDFYAKEIDGMMLDLWDLSGHPEFFEEREKFYEKSQVIIFVFDLTSRRTFDSLDMWLNEVNLYINNQDTENQQKPFFVLCGNKRDLSKYRVVPKNEAKYWARSRNIEYFEVSALEGRKLDKMFQRCSNKFRYS